MCPEPLPHHDHDHHHHHHHHQNHRHHHLHHHCYHCTSAFLQKRVGKITPTIDKLHPIAVSSIFRHKLRTLCTGRSRQPNTHAQRWATNKSQASNTSYGWHWDTKLESSVYCGTRMEASAAKGSRFAQEKKKAEHPPLQVLGPRQWPNRRTSPGPVFL